jgi:hypothetical protein
LPADIELLDVTHFGRASQHTREQAPSCHYCVLCSNVKWTLTLGEPASTALLSADEAKKHAATGANGGGVNWYSTGVQVIGP